jgi:hypothetical protein
MELWRDAGDDYSSAWTQVASYDGQASTYSFTVATDSMADGKIYRMKTRTKNAIGYSDYSLDAYIAFADLPNVPGQPTRVSSTRTSITVAWTAPTVAADDLPVLGYVLNIDDGVNQDLMPVYVGRERPEILEYTVGDLTTGLPYLFSA